MTRSLPAALLLASLLTCTPLHARERIIFLNEGTWQADNGRVSYFEDGKMVSNQWFRDVNGRKIGDTPEDIVSVTDNLIAIAVNWSNIIQFITPEGRAVAATENVPNNRKLASDGRYVYVTSYGHECTTATGTRTFEKGFVARIDATTFKVTDAVEVGYEPEGIALYNGYLFVANTGGYSFQEDHDYEKTISVIDASTMRVTRTIDTGQINLQGQMSISGGYICVGSPGDYYDVPAATVILDCEAAIAGKPDNRCLTRINYAATQSCTAANGDFYAVGSRYSYYTGEYETDYIRINPREVMESGGSRGVYEDMPGDVVAGLKQMGMPYGIFVNPYTGFIYATDAGSFASAGTLYQWSPEGDLLGKHSAYINPGHFLAISTWLGVEDTFADPSADSQDNTVYDLNGLRVDRPLPGHLYIRGGRKYIHK